MSRVGSKVLALLAAKVLEEVCRRGYVKLRFVKSYRIISYFLGEETARYILQKLQEGGYVKIVGSHVECLRSPGIFKSVEKIAKETHELVVKVLKREVE